MKDFYLVWIAARMHNFQEYSDCTHNLLIYGKPQKQQRKQQQKAEECANILIIPYTATRKNIITM
jgi:hypothetical protein